MGDRLGVLVLNERDPRHPAAGGAEVHVAEIFGRLAARGFAVTWLASGFSGGTRTETLEGIAVQRRGPLPAYYPWAAWTCVRETRRGGVDVVVECLNKVPFYAPLYAARPVLALCHHLFGEVAFQQVSWPVAALVWSAEKLIPPLYRGCDFVTISESSRQDLVARGVAAERVRVILPGIRQPEGHADAVETRAQRVVYVGRLEPYKRIDVLLRAMARIAPRFPDAEIAIAGRGSARPALERLASELGLAERTRFLGFVSDAERDALLAASRVCVCPSLKEGFGLTVVEANALGTPVVASDAPGLRDSVRHGETGLLAAAGDVVAFATQIAALLEDDALARELGAQARAWARRFDWDLAADAMAEALETASRRR
jgi:glycosyltransferase involved in cell wall biosynthesis